MLRRLIAVLLLAAVALPMPALAASRCSMTEPWISSERCDCCKGDAAAAKPGNHCGPAAAIGSGCNCSIEGAARKQPASPAAASPEAPAPVSSASLLPAALSTPQRAIRAVELAASPPGAGASISRPVLCTWIL
jgi:hypothetical protein